MSLIIWFVILVTWASCLHDYWTYEERQDRWEKLHPGEVYQRGFRKLNK